MLLLSNEDVTSVLSMTDCLDAMEAAFLDLGTGDAVSRPRSELLLPQSEAGRHYLLKTWDAALPRVGLAAIRITSNMMQKLNADGAARLDPLPLAAGGGYVGLVLLFEIRTLELVAIIQDARLQVMRAGATYGLAAKYLARKDARIMGILGSGGQAREQLTAISLVCALQQVKVFSPTKANRERFAEQMSEQLDIEVVPCDDPRTVVRGSGIVAAATSSLEPVLHGDWLEPGQHVSFAGPGKGDEGVTDRASLIVLQTNDQTLRWLPANQNDHEKDIASRRSTRKGLDAARLVLLSDVIAGHHPGRTTPDEITLFGGFNTFGPGTAYAAVGAIVLERARQKGLGRELPSDWFIQRESS
jgi:ornithine cyclodeaminase/alanine dehydrogenase-like protein (mu-crystallin family)